MNNVCPQCKAPNVWEWIHDRVVDRFVCAACMLQNAARAHSIQHQKQFEALQSAPGKQ
jgi:Zn ribbon nucleic-acid-binding protein